MQISYKPLVISALVMGGFYLWQKAKRERDPYRAMFAAAAKAPTKVKPGRLWIVQMKDGSTEEMTSAELQRKVNTGVVASYVDKEQL